MEVVALIVVGLFVFFMQSEVFKKFAFKRLDYSCEFSVKEAHVGDSIMLVETVENKKLLPIPWVKVSIHSSKWLSYAETRSVVSQENRMVASSFFLKGNQKITRKWAVKCLKRGEFTIENVTLTSGDPLGADVTSQAFPVCAKVVVFPEIINLDTLLIPSNYEQGNTLVRRWIIDDPFIIAGAREYTPRDPMNRIHWSASVRAGSLMVKKNDFTSQLTMTVILNIQSMENEYYSSIDRDTIETGIKVAASLFDRALRIGMPVRLATNGTISNNTNDKYMKTELSAGKNHICKLMEMLARLELKWGIDFEKLTEEISMEIENSEVLFITSYFNIRVYEKIANIKTRNNSITVIMLNETEFKEEFEDIKFYYLSQNDEVKYE